MTQPLYGAAAVRELDGREIAVRGVPGYTLMQRAAFTCWRAARERWPEARRVAVLCGPGNNGGDGYEIARLARDEGCAVRCFSFGEPPAGTDAERALRAWAGPVERWQPDVLEGVDLVVDAIFGIGLKRGPEAEVRAAIEAVNRLPARIGRLAVDLPSGLDADTGNAPGAVLQADLTVSFIGRKLGLYTGRGPDCVGERRFETLGVIDDGVLPALASLLEATDLGRWLPRRSRGAHKGSHGFVLLVGGGLGMAGAILLAARAALRSGAGQVAAATRSAHAAALSAAQPEAMFRGVESAAELQPLIERADVIAVGPGLGRGDWGRALWRAARDAGKPLVVDADALNLLATEPARRDWVLTPHPGEAARLLGRDVAAIAADRAAAARELRSRYGGVAVLKGAGSLIQGAELAVCPYGNPGMGAGGMGDALTGIVAALIAQGLPSETAARAGVLVHALAGDRAAAPGERGLLPSDLIDALRFIVNPGVSDGA